MRRALANVSVGRKLTLVSMTTAVVVLVLVCVAVLGFEFSSYRHKMDRDTAILADVVGANCTAALSFSDKSTALESLRALRANRHVTSACVYDKSGAPFAEYERKAHEGGCPPRSLGEGLWNG